MTVSYLDPAAAWAPQVGADRGRGTRLAAFLAARVSVRFDDSSAGVDESQEFEALYGPLDGGLDLESETIVDYDDRDFAGSAPKARPTSSRRRRSTRRRSSPAPSATSSVASSASRRSSSTATAAEAHLAARRDGGAVRRALRRGRAGRSRPGSGEAEGPAGGEARPAGVGAGAGQASRRGARARPALVPGERAHRRCGRRARRSARRTPERPLDRHLGRQPVHEARDVHPGERTEGDGRASRAAGC